MIKVLIICTLISCLMACKQTDWDNHGPIPTSRQATNISQKGNNNISFPHARHASILACNICHRDKVAKMPMDQRLGHGQCLDCHRSKGHGPTECGGCHIPEKAVFNIKRPPFFQEGRLIVGSGKERCGGH